MNKRESSISAGGSTEGRSRSVAIHGIYSLVDQGIVSVASFAMMALVGRVGKAELGIFALGITSFWLLSGISNAIVWTPYTARAAHMSSLHHKRFRGENAGLNFAIGIILAMASLVVAAFAWIAGDNQTWLVPFCLALAPLLLTLTLREFARRVYIADFEGGKLLAFDLPISLVMVALAMVFKHQGRLDATTAMLLTSAASIPAVYLTIKHVIEGEVSTARVRQVLATNWPYAKWLLIVAVAWLASDGILRWMLVGIKGEQAMGAFAGAFLIVSLINPILLAMTSFARSLASRKLASGSRQSLSSGTILSVRWLVVLAALACGALHLWGNTSMVMILGQSYSNQHLVTLLAIAVCLELVVVPVEATFVALEFGKLLSLIALGRLVISLLLGVLLIPAYGVFGVGWAMLGRSILSFGMYAFALMAVHRNFSTQPEELSGHEKGAYDTQAVEPMSAKAQVERIPVSP